MPNSSKYFPNLPLDNMCEIFHVLKALQTKVIHFARVTEISLRCRTHVNTSHSLSFYPLSKNNPTRTANQPQSPHHSMSPLTLGSPPSPPGRKNKLDSLDSRRFLGRVDTPFCVVLTTSLCPVFGAAPSWPWVFTQVERSHICLESGESRDWVSHSLSHIHQWKHSDTLKWPALYLQKAVYQRDNCFADYYLALECYYSRIYMPLFSRCICATCLYFTVSLFCFVFQITNFSQPWSRLFLRHFKLNCSIY